MNLRQTAFYLEAIDGKRFDGFTGGETWNGWDCPRFTKEQADAFVSAWNGEVCGAAGYEPACYDVERDAFVFPLDGYTDTYEATVINGRKYYAIGAWGWCWSEIEEAEEIGA